jgi:hypothetical protein
MFRVKRWPIILASVFVVMLVAGCSMKPEDFKDTGPRLDIQKYFVGETRAWGIFEDRFGKLRRQFVVDITGTMEGDVLVLDEHFEYADGEKDRRVWRITKLDEHNYEGRADDVIGVAKGESYGNALNWSYVLDLEIGNKTVRVHFNDWMFLQPDGVLMNRARVSKWGFEIGEVTLMFKPLKAEEKSSRLQDSMEQYATFGEVREAANR